LANHQRIQKLGIPGVQVIQANVYDPEGNVAGEETVPLPEKVLDYDSQDMPIQHEVLNWLPKDTVYAQKMYQADDDFAIQVSVVLMGTDRTSIHKPEYCLQAAGFGSQKQLEEEILVEKPHRYMLPVMKMVTSKSVTLENGVPSKVSGIYVYWFVADNELTATHGERMWWMARDLITDGVLQRWAYISAFSICHPGFEDETYERMSRFIGEMVPAFQIATGPPLTLASHP
jgi:hypothetical protein